MNERRKKQNKKAVKDGYFPVILSQLMCSAAAVMMFFFTSSTSQGYEIIAGYKSLLQEDFLTYELDSAVSGMKDYLVDGVSSFAVFNNRVEPYDESVLTESHLPGEETTDEAVTDAEAESAEAEADTENFLSYENEQLTVLTGARVYDDDEKPSSVPLKLSYKKEQKMIMPLDEGRYTSYYGERTDPISEGSDFHKGIDIGADEGDRIRAVLDGEVISVGEDDRSGKYIFLRHKNGSVTFYCHCSKVIKKKGDTVSQGEAIALVGSTGYSTGPHLHFEVRVKGVSIDPLPLLEHAD